MLATYDKTTAMWTYLKYKGPLFLVEDKLKHKKLIILNQMATKNDFILPVTSVLCRFWRVISLNSRSWGQMAGICLTLELMTRSVGGLSREYGARMKI